jgi:hypothetical protein
MPRGMCGHLLGRTVPAAGPNSVGPFLQGRIWRLVQTVTKPLPEHVGLARIVAVVIDSSLSE